MSRKQRDRRRRQLQAYMDATTAIGRLDAAIAMLRARIVQSGTHADAHRDYAARVIADLAENVSDDAGTRNVRAVAS